MTTFNAATSNRRLLLLLIFCVIIRFYIKRRRKSKKLQLQKHIKIVKTPLITFSGGGLIAFYYQGVSAYLRDNFNLDEVRFAGVSMGAAAAASLGVGLSTEATMLFGLKWIKMLSERPLKLFLLSPSALIQTGMQISEQFGITDEQVRRKSQQKRVYYGITNISAWPPKHELLSDFSSRKQGFYALSCSMRILPFFRSVGYYQNRWCVDGGFSAIYSIPKDAEPSQVIKVSVSTRVNADICPDPQSQETFRIMDFFIIPNVQQINQQFERGYNDAIRSRNTLIGKGLKPISDENRLEEHMALLKKHCQAILEEK